MKDIKGYEGRYAITSCGKVWSYYRNRFMKPETTKNGYNRVILFDSNGNKKHFFVHRLVAEAYLPNPYNLPCVNHKDEVRTNNYLNNLEWCDYSYNNQYGDRIKKVSDKTSKKVKQMTMDGIVIKVWDSAAEASRELGICQVYRAANGARKSAGGYKWEYVGG